MLTIYTLRVELVSLVASGFGVLPLLPGQVDVLTSRRTNYVLALDGAGEEIGFAPNPHSASAFYWSIPFTLEQTLISKTERLVAWLRTTARGWDRALNKADEVAKFVLCKHSEGLGPGN
jgi:hypothetical protein